jgi:large subunit ribosomal protein L24
MKKEWSPKWNSSAQPRKQRKYVHNAPLHAKRKFLSASLSSALRESMGKRSMVVRKGDEVVIMRGDLKGKRGPVESVSISKGKIFIEGIKVKKVDGSEVPKPIAPSNVQITKLKLDDKRRQSVVERSGSAGNKQTVKKTAAKKEKGE